eukprot:364227-Chlamydomonas_euryale.AAC.9
MFVFGETAGTSGLRLPAGGVCQRQAKATCAYEEGREGACMHVHERSTHAGTCMPCPSCSGWPNATMYKTRNCGFQATFLGPTVQLGHWGAHVWGLGLKPRPPVPCITTKHRSRYAQLVWKSQ